MKKSPILLLLLPATLLADEVLLKDAGSITGRVIEQTATTVRVDVGGGVIGVPMERVDRVVKGRCALDDYDERAKKLAPNDLSGWKKLGQWASEAGLSAQAREAYQRVLKLAPNDPQANEAMGLVQLDGRWVTEEESFRARGFIQYDGEWMTPAEAQVLQTREANDQARRDAEQRAKEAEEKAEEAQRYSYNQPVYWGGWGYGVSAWPSTPAPAPTFTPWSEIRRMPK